MKNAMLHSLLLVSLVTILTAGMSAGTLQFSITDEDPVGGIWIMRPWIGLHDGGFQTFTVGQPAPSGVQHIAEDGVTGDTSNLSLLSGPSNSCVGNPAVYGPDAPCQNQIFAAYPGGSQQVSIGGPAIPGATLIANLTVNPSDPKSQYLSFLVMFIPSNDAFYGTDSAHPIQLFDSQGRFNGGNGPIQFDLYFSDILDAGTEVNTESHPDTAFLGQKINGTGIHPDYNPVVHQHDPFGSGILNGNNIYPGSQYNQFYNANFSGPVVQVTISYTP